MQKWADEWSVLLNISVNQIMVINVKQKWKRIACTMKIVTNGAPLHNPLHWFHLKCKFAWRLTHSLICFSYVFLCLCIWVCVAAAAAAVFFVWWCFASILFNCGAWMNVCIEASVWGTFSEKINILHVNLYAKKRTDYIVVCVCGIEKNWLSFTDFQWKHSSSLISFTHSGNGKLNCRIVVEHGKQSD